MTFLFSAASSRHHSHTLPSTSNNPNRLDVAGWPTSDGCPLRVRTPPGESISLNFWPPANSSHCFSVGNAYLLAGGNLPPSISVSLLQNSLASFQLTCSAGWRALTDLLGLAAITLRYSACVTSYFPTNMPEGTFTSTIPMLFVTWLPTGPENGAEAAADFGSGALVAAAALDSRMRLPSCALANKALAVESPGRETRAALA